MGGDRTPGGRKVEHMSRYDLVAIDLDGTLLGPDHRVSARNIEAVRAARAAGMRVCVCTGRGYRECRDIAETIEQVEPLAVAGGAILAEAASGRTLHRFPMTPGLVHRLVRVLVDHGHAALVLKDPSATSVDGERPGHDYVVVSPKGEAGIDPVSRWWFDMLKIDVKVVRDLAEDAHPEHTVRVGVCGSRRETRQAAAELREAFASEVTLHHFGAVVPSFTGDEEDGIVILEAFDRTVNKWTAVRWLAERDGIDPARIAAIGNDVNDVALLQGAGLGVAMGNAVPECAAVATRTTLGNDRDGVAHALEMMLSGAW